MSCRTRRSSADLALSFVLAWGSAACTGEGEGGRPSILLVSIDTLRQDRLGCYGYDAAGTPVLDELAETGVLFESAYTSVPVTLPSHASILTGTWPTWHGVRDNGSFQLDPEVVSVARVAQEAGYATGAVIAALPLAARFGLDQGFDAYDEAGRDEETALHGRRAPVVTAAAQAWLEQVGEGPFLLWAHYFDPHYPYAPPEPYRSQHGGDPYQGEVAATDAALGELIASARAHAGDENLIVVIVSDHGEGLGEHGEATHGQLLHDATMRVPLIFAGPGVPRQRRESAVVRTIDIAPTLAELCDLPVPASVQGRSLVPVWEGREQEARAAYLETHYPRLHHGWSALQGLVDTSWKWVEAPQVEGAERTELYHLHDDPAELENRATSERARAAEMSSALAELLASSTPTTPFAAQRDLEREVAEGLALLGYTGGEVELGETAPHPAAMLAVMEAYDLASYYLSLGRPPSALEHLEAVEAREPGGVSALELRARYELGTHRAWPDRLQRAEDCAREAAVRSPSNGALWALLGEVLLARDELEPALEALEQGRERGHVIELALFREVLSAATAAGLEERARALSPAGGG